MTIQGLSGLIPLSAYQFFVRRNVIGLFYHLVSEHAIAHTAHLYSYRPTHLFEQDLLTLKNSFHVISYDDLINCYSSRKKLPPKSVILSFDDGFAECFSVVRPLLLKHNLPCTFFLATDFIDNRAMYYRNKVSLCISRIYELPQSETKQEFTKLNHAFKINIVSTAAFIQWIKSITDEQDISNVCNILGINIEQYLETNSPYLTSQQIRTMVTEGFTFGAHSRRHHKLNQLEEVDVVDEIVGSCQVIYDKIGQEPVPFSFPNSAAGIDRHLLSTIIQKHPRVGLLFDTKGLYKDMQFIINRIWVESPQLNPGGILPLMQIIQRAYHKYMLERIKWE